MTLLEERPVITEPTREPTAVAAVKRNVGGTRLAARLAWREVRHRWGRTIVVVLLIATPVAAMAIGDMNHRADHGVSSNRGWIGSADARLDFNEVETIPRGKDFRSIVTPVLPASTAALWIRSTYGVFRREGGDGKAVRSTVTDLDLGDPLSEGMLGKLQGRIPKAADEVLLSTTVAKQFGVHLGDSLTLVRPHQTFTVVGVADQLRPEFQGNVGIVAPGFDFAEMAPGYVSQSVLLGGPAWADHPDQSAALVRRAAGLTDSNAATEPGTSSPTGGAYLGLPATFAFGPVGPPVVGWLYGTLAMAVLGVIVAAAFAVSGRRQLTTVGQLSAQGATVSVIRRFLVLQGIATGAIGAGLGLLVGRALWTGTASQQRLARSSLAPIDLTAIGLTALVVATVAALLPSRALTRVSVLTALAGRRPVGRMPRHLAAVGVLLTFAGLAGIVAAVVQSRHGRGDGALLAILGAAATFAGVCSLCPPLVERVARLAARRPGSARLAARGLSRHRPRSAALLASIIAIGAAGTALATYGEHQVDLDQRVPPGLPADVISVSSYPTPEFGDDVATIDPAADPELAEPGIRGRVESVLGPVEWIPTRQAIDSASYLAANYPGVTYDPNACCGAGTDQVSDETFALIDDGGGMPITNVAYIATDSLLDVLQVGQRGRDLLRERGALFFHKTATSYRIGSSWGRRQGEVAPAIVIPGVDPLPIPSERQSNHEFSTDYLLMTSEMADALGLDIVDGPVFARADAPITARQSRALVVTDANDRISEAAEFGDPTPAHGIQIETPPLRKSDRRIAYRAGIAAGALLLVLLVIGFGMALWAAEGRDEQRMLAAIGASPQALARTTAWRALILTATGVMVAVPLGYGTVWMVAKSLGRAGSAPIPWLVGTAVLVVVPPLVAGASLLASTLGRRFATSSLVDQTD